MKAFRAFGWRVSWEREARRRKREIVTVGARPFLLLENGAARHVQAGERVEVDDDLAAHLRAVGKAEP